MRIAMLSRYQGNVNRGAESFVSELSQRLKKEFEVEIISGEDSDNLTKMISGNFDIIMPMNGRTQSLKASFGRLFKKYKVVISGQSGMGRDDIWNITIARPDVFVALTECMEGWAKKWAHGIKVVKIPNAVDLQKFNPAGIKLNIALPRPIVLSVGALEWYKHHERTIKALANTNGISLLIVGKGSEKEKLQKYGKETLGNRFMIMDANYADMPSIYRSCDLFALPSWSREAFGIVYLEAMASGLGVVAPDDLSRREIVGEAGFFVDVSNPQEYAHAINKALTINWKEKPRKQAERFSWDIVAKKYSELFKSLI